MTSDPAAEPPVFTLSCSSAGGPIRGFSCTSTGSGTIGGEVSLRDPTDTDNLELGNYDLSVTVEGRYPGDYTCQVTVERYDGVGDEPDTLVFPGSPGSSQTIRVRGEPADS